MKQKFVGNCGACVMFSRFFGLAGRKVLFFV